MRVRSSNLRYSETFFSRWSDEMAYILGYFAADGSMYQNKRGGSYIGFYSIDLELIESVKSLLKVTNKIEVRNRQENWQTSYTLQIGSKNIFNHLLNLGFTSNKSLSLRLPKIPDNLFCHFLRGYFDGDGGVYYQTLIRKNRPNPTFHLHLNIRCGNKIFLEEVNEKLTRLIDIRGGSIYFHSRAYSLAYYGRDVIELYSFLYPHQAVPCLVRKKIKLEEGIKQVRP